MSTRNTRLYAKFLFHRCMNGRGDTTDNAIAKILNKHQTQLTRL